MSMMESDAVSELPVVIPRASTAGCGDLGPRVGVKGLVEGSRPAWDEVMSFAGGWRLK